MPYRAVVRHVRYWRGVIHKWSTVYPFLGTPTSGLTTADAQAVLLADDRMCYGLAAADGGTYECDLYDQAVGGVPIASYTHFDWTTPASWIKYGGAAWGVTGTPFLPYAEVALQVEWPAGLSHSGKPVFLRKWYHALPDQGTPANGPDVPATNVTALQAGAVVVQQSLASKGMSLGSASGRFAGTPVVKNMFGNHQMPRGRRRKALVSASGHYTGPTVQVPPIEAD